MNGKFHQRDVFVENSFGLRFEKSKQDYIRCVNNIGKTKYVIHFDWGRSSRTINQQRLLEKIQPLLCPRIYKFILNFLKIPMLDSEGNHWTMKGKGIPPVGTLAYVLLNFYLDQIDRELQRVLPEGAKSYRYVYISSDTHR